MSINLVSCSSSKTNFTKLHNESPKILPSIEIRDNYFSPKKGMPFNEASDLIIIYLKKEVKGDIETVVEIEEITIQEAWENAGIQLYHVKVDYAWLDGVAIVRENKVLKFLHGMPTHSVFLSDLDYDSIYEVYTNISMGSGIVSDEILGFNIALNESYCLSRRGNEDLSLFIQGEKLMVKEKPHMKQNTTESKVGSIVLKIVGNERNLEVELESGN